MIDRIIGAFDKGFCRPEFCKVEVTSQKQYDANLEEENKKRRQIMKFSQNSTGQSATLSSLEKEENEERLLNPAKKVKEKNEVEERILGGKEEYYRRFMGRIRVIESEKEIKMLPGGTVYARPFVEKVNNIKVQEDWIMTKIKVRKMLSEHYTDAL